MYTTTAIHAVMALLSRGTTKSAMRVTTAPATRTRGVRIAYRSFRFIVRQSSREVHSHQPITTAAMRHVVEDDAGRIAPQMIEAAPIAVTAVIRRQRQLVMRQIEQPEARVMLFISQVGEHPARPG